MSSTAFWPIYALLQTALIPITIIYFLVFARKREFHDQVCCRFEALFCPLVVFEMSHTL